MNHVGRSHSQRTHTPRHTSPSVPLRDLTDAEISEQVDTDAERREELLHANAVRFCLTCATTVLTRRRDKSCLWCDGPTTLAPVGLDHATADLPARNSSQAPARSTQALGAAGAREPKPDYVVDEETGCWVWQRACSSQGYALLRRNSVTFPAHRIYYERYVGEIPEDFVVDHLCRNPACVNPEHLEAVTSAENTRRGFSPAAIAGRRTHCAQGHPFDEANTFVTRDGRRQCRECARARSREYYRAKGSTEPGSRSGENHPQARLSDADVCAIRERHSRGESVRDLADEYGLNRNYAQKIVNNVYRQNAKPSSGASESNHATTEEQAA